jgi:signal transduction histidine kinase
MNVRHYFIGHVLNHEKNVLKQASIKLVFNVISISAVVMFVFACVYGVKANYVQVAKSVIVGGLFTSLLFYIRHYRSIDGACHMLMILALINNTLNIIFFGEFNFIVSLLTVTNVLFAFHTLGNKVGFVYAILHFATVAVYYILKDTGHAMVISESGPMGLVQFLITLAILAFIITYLIYHYHKAYESARLVIEDSVNEMRKAKEMAEEMTKMKSNFLSSMSHEIRTPINGILGLSQIIELETDNPTILEYVRLQKQSGERLLNTVGSILDLSRLEAQQNVLSLKVVDVNSLVNEVIQTLRQLAENKKIELTFKQSSKPLKSLSDDTLLYQVITNIIGNAIKFTVRGKVEVRVSSDHDNKLLIIEVEDTGIGISDEFKSRIFNPFEQESTGRSRSHDGTGLGLSISKRFIELLGGEIRLTSEKGVGSLFQILLPIYQS